MLMLIVIKVCSWIAYNGRGKGELTGDIMEVKIVFSDQLVAGKKEEEKARTL